MDTSSLWQGTAVKLACLPTLQTDISVDVAIVGGGITGLTAAMLLAAGGKRVAVLDAHRIGGASTGHSTGNLYAPVDLHDRARGPGAVLLARPWRRLRTHRTSHRAANPGSPRTPVPRTEPVAIKTGASE